MVMLLIFQLKSTVIRFENDDIEIDWGNTTEENVYKTGQNNSSLSS